VEALSPDDATIASTFDRLDANGDGSVSIGEIARNAPGPELRAFAAFVVDEMKLGAAGEDLARVPAVDRAALEQHLVPALVSVDGVCSLATTYSSSDALDRALCRQVRPAAAARGRA